MAIALDVATTSAATTSSPLTWSHTCTGSNLLLVVGVGVSSYISGQATVTGVTYNSVTMYKARSDQSTGGTESSVWLLENPSTGSNTVSVTWTYGSGQHAGGTSVSYTGCSQTHTPDAVNGTTGTGTGDKTFAVTTSADNCWVFVEGVEYCLGIGTTMTTDQTSRGAVTLNSSNPVILHRAEDTNGVKHPAGSQTMGFTIATTTGTPGYAFSGASFAPYVAGGATSHNLSLLGVGI
jgi:hypothetical protein